MSQERDVNTPTGRTKRLTKQDINTLSEQELDQHVAAVLDRGLTNARLKVDLPDDLIGEWVPDDAMAIYEKELLGFTKDTEYATRHALHSQNGEARLGDTIFMIAPKRLMDAIEKKRAKDYHDRHGKKAGKGSTVEEKGFESENAGTGLRVVNESSTEEVSTAAIIAAREAADAANKETKS